jgi:hypothetical protein
VTEPAPCPRCLGACVIYEGPNQGCPSVAEEANECPACEGVGYSDDAVANGTLPGPADGFFGAPEEDPVTL